MPLYEYECARDGTFELVRKFSDPPLAACPTCGGPVEKLLSAPAIQFKGTGWYITDYARKSTGGEAAGNKDKGSGDSGKKDGGGTDKAAADSAKGAAATSETKSSSSDGKSSSADSKSSGSDSKTSSDKNK